MSYNNLANYLSEKTGLESQDVHELICAYESKFSIEGAKVTLVDFQGMAIVQHLHGNFTKSFSDILLNSYFPDNPSLLTMNCTLMKILESHFLEGVDIHSESYIKGLSVTLITLGNRFDV